MDGSGFDGGDETLVTTAGKPDKKKFGTASKKLRKSSGSIPLSHRATMDWRRDASIACDENSSERSDIHDLKELTDTLRLSRTAAAMLDACGDSLSIVYDAQTAQSQFYARAEKQVITLHPMRPRGVLLNTLSREIRRAWQFKMGALVNPLSFEPDEAILVNRAQQADALMASIRIAWELKLLDLPEAWNAIAGSPAADVGRVFEIKAQSDFRSLNNGEAARAAYDRYFEGSRTKAHDKGIIHQMLLDETGYIRHGQVRPQLTMDLFQKLGEMPHGRNYLAMASTCAPTDARYATVEDRSNANFLWFIKFERSFLEKERKMVEDSVRLSAEIVDFAKWSLNRGQPAKNNAPGV